MKLRGVTKNKTVLMTFWYGMNLAEIKFELSVEDFALWFIRGCEFDQGFKAPVVPLIEHEGGHKRLFVLLGF